MNSFNNVKNVEELFDFFKVRNFLEQQEFDYVNDELNKLKHKYFEFSDEGDLVLIVSYEDNTD